MADKSLHDPDELKADEIRLESSLTNTHCSDLFFYDYSWTNNAGNFIVSKETSPIAAVKGSESLCECGAHVAGSTHAAWCPEYRS